MYDISGTGNICEHDVFQILHYSKENIPIESYLDLLESEKLYNEIVINDEISDLFINAFASDISKVSKFLNTKRLNIIKKEYLK